MAHAPRRGFTLVEILIVVILLGILAAIVVPQFSGATTEARASALLSDLRILRSQIQLYKAQHDDAYPGATFIAQMTTYSDAAGKTAPGADATYLYGPYLRSMPKNPVSGVATIRIVNGAARAFSAPKKDSGWWYNASTGEIRADLTNTRKTSDGRLMNQL